MPWPRSQMRRLEAGECLLCEEAAVSAAPTCGFVMINTNVLALLNLRTFFSLRAPDSLVLDGLKSGSDSSPASAPVRSGLRWDLHQLTDPRRRSLGRLTDYEFSGDTRPS